MPDLTGRLSTGECLDAELLSAYIDGTLEVRERADAEAHLASCADCYDVMSEVLRIRNELSAARPVIDAAPALSSTPPVWAAQERPDVSAPVPPPGSATVVRGAFGRRKAVLGVAGGVLAAAAALVLMVRLQPTWWAGGVDPKLADLVEAVGEERTVEARLTGGFKYGPLRSPVRSGGRVGPTDNWSLLAAAGRIREEAEKASTPENLHALGVAQLLVGQYGEGVATLEELVFGDPKNAAFQSDLSAAYLSRAAAQARSDDWSKALTAAERAIAVEPDLLEALFNRALALEGLLLPEQAEEAWKAYLALDPSSPWAEQARQRLTQLTEGSATSRRFSPDELLSGRPLLSSDEISDLGATDPATLRLWVLGVLLDHRVRAQGLETPADVDDALRHAAAVLERVSIDRLVPDIAASLLTPSLPSDGQLDSALSTFAEAIRLAHEDRVSEAHERFERVIPILARTSLPLRLVTAYHLTTLPSQRGDLANVQLAISKLAPEARDHGYYSLLGLLLWRRGLAFVREGSLEQAIGAYGDALDAFESAKEEMHAANVHSLLAEAYRTLGDMRVAWVHHRQSLQGARLAHHRILHQILSQHSLSSLAENRPESAAWFQAAAIANAEKWGRASALVMAHVQQARAQATMGRRDTANRNVRQAEGFLAQVPDQGFRARVEAEVLMARGEVSAMTSAGALTPDLDRAIDWFGRAGSSDRVGALQFARGAVFRRRGFIEQAERDWAASLEWFERSRQSLRRDQLRMTHAGSMATVVNALADVASARGDSPEQVLSLIERARARTLMEQLSAYRGEPLSLGEIRRKLVPGTALVYYFSLGSDLHAGVVRDESVAVIPLSITTTQFARLKRRYVATGIAGRPLHRRFNQEMFEVLARRVQARLNGIQTLVIIPDAMTSGIAWAALEDPKTQKLVLDLFEVAIAPSASIYAHLLPVASAPVADGRGLRAEFFGQGVPPLDEHLLPLPGAEAEAKSSAKYYANSRVWLNEQATATQFLEALRRADLVHFAGHAVQNPEFPLLSRLLLSAAKDHGPRLFADEVASLPFVSARLVVLAACSTAGADSPGEYEGTLGVARPLLAAGVPHIVASFWDVEDRSTSWLMESLHRRLSTGERPGAALRAAQLEIRALPESKPSDWAAFGLFGVPH